MKQLLLLPLLTTVMFSGEAFSAAQSTDPSTEVVLKHKNILPEECRCAGVTADNDPRPLLRRLINSSDHELARFKEKITESLKHHCQLFLSSFNNLEQLITPSSNEYIRLVKSLEQILYYMDKNSELYNNLNKLYIELKPFEAMATAEQQKTELVQIITRDYPQIINLVNETLSNPSEVVRKNCICKEEMKEQVADLELDLQKSDEKIKSFNETKSEFSTANKNGTAIESGKLNAALSDFCSVFNILATVIQKLSYIIRSEAESDVLDKLLSYIKTISPEEVTDYEAFNTESENLLKIYNEQKDTVILVIKEVKDALAVSDEISTDDLAYKQYLELKETFAKLLSIMQRLASIYEK